MLRIYAEELEMLDKVRPLLAAIERKDRDLANQLRRAAASVALNTEEGSGSSKGTREARYQTALGSAKETRACLQVASRLYGLPVDGDVLDRLDKIIATLFKLTR